MIASNLGISEICVEHPGGSWSAGENISLEFRREV